MDKSNALNIITALADGVDPETGEELSQDSCFNQPQVIRALFVAKDSIDKAIKSDKNKSELPENAGKPWKAEDDESLAKSFDAGLDIGELASAHKRTKGSITSRLVRLGKIEERSDVHTREFETENT